MRLRVLRRHRLALAHAKQEWFEPPVEPILPIYTRQLDGYTFRCAATPRIFQREGCARTAPCYSV